MAPAQEGGHFDRGRRIGKYEILTRLSMGGMAELYLAFLPGPGGFKKFVAVKQILPDVKRDEAFVKMFLDEARITAAFNHANIGQVFDLGEEQGELYLAMEFIAGQNLQQVIQRAAKTATPIPTGFAARVIRDTCLGLHYAHQFREPSTGQPLPVIHRDVSPKNIMIAYTGDIKVIDFGIAKARGRLNRTQVGIVKGTSGYMAPEQVRNDKMDGRADLFAAAVICHELLTGERLFSAPTDASMMLAIVEQVADSPAKVNPGVSSAFAQVVLKALSKSKEARFGSGKELARAIEQSCEVMFEEEETAAFMQELFADKIALTRSLLELANDAQADEIRMTKAVQRLAQDEIDAAVARSKKYPSKPISAPKQPSSPKLPKVEGVRSPSIQKLPRVASSQSLPKVATGSRPERQEGRPGASQQKLPKVVAQQDLDQTILPQSRSSRKLDVVSPAPLATPPNPQAKPAVRRAVAPTLVAIFAMAGAGGGVFALSKTSLKEKVLDALKGDQTPLADPNAQPEKVQLTEQTGASKPQWVLDKEAEQAQRKRDREEMDRIEALQNAPERVKALEEIRQELGRIYKMEEEQRQLKIEAARGSSAGAANSRRIEDLQSQIDQLKAAVGAKQKRASSNALGADASVQSDEVQVVSDSKQAAKASLGFLTLSTYNPSKAQVSEGGEALEATPLRHLALSEGVHILHILDGESKVHRLTVRISKGKESVYQNVDVSALPLVQP